MGGESGGEGKRGQQVSRKVSMGGQHGGECGGEQKKRAQEVSLEVRTGSEWR